MKPDNYQLLGLESRCLVDANQFKYVWNIFKTQTVVKFHLFILYKRFNFNSNHIFFGADNYREALKVSEAILDTSCDMNYKWMAMYVKAESLFNMCDFEHALVFYLRAKRLAPTSVSWNDLQFGHIDIIIRQLIPNNI